MRNKQSVGVMGLSLIIGIVVVGLAMFRLTTFGLTMFGLITVNLQEFAGATENRIALAQSEQAAPAQSSALQVAGSYAGIVKLAVAVGGVYSDTLATPPPPGAGTPTPPDLGSIDLSLQLTQTGAALSGYINLDKTLVFSAEHTLGSGASSLQIGPYVNGSFDGTNLVLQSERVSIAVSGRSVLRQFRLTGKTTTSDGSQISGEYRETLWGYSSVPVTVIGTFNLQRPVFGVTTASTNQSPVAAVDNATTLAGNAITINVLANDSDPNNDTLTITSLSKPQFGTATISGNKVVYTPNSNFAGTDTFSYVVSDGKGGTTVGSVSVVVNGSNQAPTATDDTTTTAQGVAVIIDVLVNDADPNGDALNLAIDGPPTHGTATVNNGKIVYTPQADFVGTDSFTYTIGDGKGGTASATVTITVTEKQQERGATIYLPLISK